MKRIRKKTDKVAEELISLRNSRKSIDDFFFSHMINFTENCRLMHSFLSDVNKNRDLFKVAYRQYYVFLVSSWETFFRDVFVYVHTKDKEAVSNLLNRLKPAIDTFDESEIKLPEILSKSFNFQNLQDLEYAYDGMWGESFLRYICTTDLGPCGVNGKVSNSLVVEKLFKDWHSIIESSFSIRHQVVHDANYRPNIDIEFIKNAETIFLFVPQIATHFISEKYKLDRVMLSNGSFNVPAIFTVSEILSENWEVVE